jgi:predicted ester cyclase
MTENASAGYGADAGGLTRRWFRDVWTEDGEAVVDAMMADDGHGWIEGGFVKSPTEFKGARQLLLAAFPDLAISVEDLIVDGDKVAVRWTVEATHKGGGLGLAPTGKRVAFRGMTWMEWRNGKMARGWDSWNLGGLLEELRSAAASTE